VAALRQELIVAAVESEKKIQFVFSRGLAIFFKTNLFLKSVSRLLIERHLADKLFVDRKLTDAMIARHNDDSTVCSIVGLVDNSMFILCASVNCCSTK
jgi:hypothetical protein